jgi:LmbE family N-acetylglucosaminyl deacetylase
VNLAARIMSYAKLDGVTVSDRTRDDVVQRGESGDLPVKAVSGCCSQRLSRARNSLGSQFIALITNMANVLVIAPHPDDESIGCGGSLRLHALRGDRIHVLFLTSGELGLKTLPREEAWRIREAEAQAAASVLGIAQTDFLRQPDGSVHDHLSDCIAAVQSIVRTDTPATLYVPHAAEWHPDHRAAANIVRQTLADPAIPTPHCRFYEIWTPLTTFDEIEDISATMEDKRKAIRCHQSQIADIAYDRAIAGLNQYRGLIGPRCEYAEVFQLLASRP